MLEQLVAELAYQPAAITPEGALPFPLEDPAQIVEANIDELILTEDPWFAEPDGLFRAAQAQGEFLLHAIVFKGDYYGAPDAARSS